MFITYTPLTNIATIHIIKVTHTATTLVVYSTHTQASSPEFAAKLIAGVKLLL